MGLPEHQVSRAELAAIPGVSSALVDVATLVETRYLPVAEALVPLLPGKGIPRGSRLQVSGGRGSVSLGLALVAEAMRQGSWAAVVGVPWLGLAAMHEHAIPLHQLVLVDQVDSQWGAVMAALVDGFDIVMFSGQPDAQKSIGARDARRVMAHAREKGAVLMEFGQAATSLESADLWVSVVGSSWMGAGHGHGHFTHRQVEVTVSARRGRSGQSHHLWLPDEAGVVRVATPDEVVFGPQALRSVAALHA